jgi:hypothetical protein
VGRRRDRKVDELLYQCWPKPRAAQTLQEQLDEVRAQFDSLGHSIERELAPLAGAFARLGAALRRRIP